MKFVFSVLLILLVPISSVYAELTITITQGDDNPTAIAVSPFNFTGGSALPENISQIISDDLERTGQFGPIDPSNMLSYPSQLNEVVYSDWRLLGSDYLVIGNVIPKNTGYELTYSLFDVPGQRPLLLNQVVSVNSGGLRDMAHHVSDKIYELITGIRGAFSTQIVYVEQQKSIGQYRLVRADMDGARPQILLKTSEPLLSPSWSPDGQSVAYVSFETGRPAIFVQNLQTGQRQQVTNFKGLNGAPSWSPDGKRLAVVLSKDGNPEIYVLDLASRRFTRMTNHFGIDTEPTWTSDGRSILFTSNRGGQPQIYRVDISGGSAQRVTFEGNYNARAQVTPDGEKIVMVHRRGDVFHIATQHLSTGEVNVLTRTSLDESPSIAPNGASLIYATKLGSKGVLASVSLDAGAKFTLPSSTGDVREPAWSPYFK